MARQVTKKDVQIHFECVCGRNEVYTDLFSVKWSELTKYHVIRKKDRKTGERFLLYLDKAEECHCYDD